MVPGTKAWAKQWISQKKLNKGRRKEKKKNIE